MHVAPFEAKSLATHLERADRVIALITSRGLDATAPLQMSRPSRAAPPRRRGWTRETSRCVSRSMPKTLQPRLRPPPRLGADHSRRRVRAVRVRLARRWYRVDEEAEEPGMTRRAPRRFAPPRPRVLRGSARRRAAPALVLAPVRSKWAGAARAPTPRSSVRTTSRTSSVVPSGSNASTASNALASVRDTVRNLDRIMGILAPARASGARDATSRPRRRAGQKAHGGAGFATTGFATGSARDENENHHDDGDEEDERRRLSRSAPAFLSRMTSSRLDAPLSAWRAGADPGWRGVLEAARRASVAARWAGDRLCGSWAAR